MTHETGEKVEERVEFYREIIATISSLPINDGPNHIEIKPIGVVVDRIWTTYHSREWARNHPYYYKRS